MSHKKFFTKDLLELGSSLLNDMINDPVTMKELEIVGTLATKDKTSTDEIKDLFSTVQSNHKDRISQKQDMLKIISEQLNQASIIEAVKAVASIYWECSKTDSNAKKAPNEEGKTQVSE